MIISVIVTMLTNYLGMPLVYLTAACFFSESEGVYVNAKLRMLWFGSLFYHQRANHRALSRPSRLLHISILSKSQEIIPQLVFMERYPLSSLDKLLNVWSYMLNHLQERLENISTFQPPDGLIIRNINRSQYKIRHPCFIFSYFWIIFLWRIRLINLFFSEFSLYLCYMQNPCTYGTSWYNHLSF